MSQDYDVGDVVTYRAFGGELRIVVVTARHADVKNGRPGFDAEMISEGASLCDHTSTRVWGYDTQIEKVVRRDIR